MKVVTTTHLCSFLNDMKAGLLGASIGIRYNGVTEIN